MKILYRINLLVLALLIIFTSCNTEQKKPDNDKKPAATDKKIFKYNQGSGIYSLDPAFAKDQASSWATNQLYNGLLQLDDDLNVKKCIAKNFEVNEESTVYTFYLRTDVYFHDHPQFKDGKGRRVVAQDFVYSFNRLLDPKLASPGLWIFNGKVDMEEGPFLALDDSTFQLVLSKPFRPILSLLTMQYCSVVPKEVAEHYGKDFRKNPIGTGPFKLKFLKENERMFLVKNENYWEKGLPKIDQVNVSFVDNKGSEFLMFEKGEIDFISGLDATYINDLLSKKGELKEERKSVMYMQKAPFLNTEYLGILMDLSGSNDKTSALAEKNVRKAINIGFDRERMMKTLRNNVGKPATSGFIPYGLPAFKETNKIKYNPDEARKLLIEAGFTESNKPKVTLLTNTSYKDFGVYIINQLKEIGFEAEMEITPSGVLRERMANGSANFFRGSWIADYPDAENYMTLFYGKNPSPPNYTRFKNAEYDRLYEQCLVTIDDVELGKLYQQMNDILIEEAPVIPLFYDEKTVFVNNRVKGMSNNAMNLLILKNVELN